MSPIPVSRLKCNVIQVTIITLNQLLITGEYFLSREQICALLIKQTCAKA